MQNNYPLFVLVNGDGSRGNAGTRGKKLMQAILEQNLTLERVNDRNDDSLGTRIGLLGKIFGCWHKRLTRPFSDKKVAYRACLECGARRVFDTKSFKTLGTFYYPPSVAFDRNRANS